MLHVPYKEDTHALLAAKIKRTIVTRLAVTASILAPTTVMMAILKEEMDVILDVTLKMDGLVLRELSLKSAMITAETEQILAVIFAMIRILSMEMAATSFATLKSAGHVVQETLPVLTHASKYVGTAETLECGTATTAMSIMATDVLLIVFSNMGMNALEEALFILTSAEKSVEMDLILG